jgi:hypothetical protein
VDYRAKRTVDISLPHESLFTHSLDTYNTQMAYGKNAMILPSFFREQIILYIKYMWITSLIGAN